MRPKSFRQKKINRLEIVLTTSFYNTTIQLNIQMETFQTFKIFKNCSKDCLEWSNKNWKTFFQKAPNKADFIQKVSNKLSCFPWKRFQLRHPKTCKKLKNALFKRSEHSFLSSRWLQDRFLRSFLWPNFDLNKIWCFAWLS